MLKLAVIGAGIIGARHLEAAALMEELQAVAVVDLNEERAAELAVQHGIHVFTDYEEMLRSEKPDIVVVALPHFLHRSVAMKCMEHGCHVLLEKPMALNIEECNEIMAAAQKHQVQLLVGHTQHYHPDNIVAKRIIESGELGELVMISDNRHVNYYRPDRPAWFFEKSKAGGGIFSNLGSHSIDKIQWLTGSKVVSVKSSLTFHGDRGDIEGSGQMFLKTSKGISATVAQSGYPGGVSRNETEIVFTRGMLKLETNSGLSISRGGKFEPVEVEPMELPFVRQFRDLIQAIRTGEQPECSGAYSRTVISVLESVYRSHETGKEEEVRQFD